MVATTSAVVVSFVVPLCLLVQTLAEDRAMAAADQEARNVAIVVAGLHGSPQLAELVADIDARALPSTTVLTARGRQLGTGPAMAEDPDVRRALTGEAFTSSDELGSRVLLPVVLPQGTAVVRTTVTTSDLHRGVLGAWVGIVGLGLVLLAAALTIALRLGRRISEPLLEVAGTAHRLRAGELSARAQVSGTEETQELARALNGLATRNEELLAHERQAVGDLSHRLRTPVTALRLDAEAVDEPVLADRLQEHIAVLERTIDAIVKEARRPVSSDLAPQCDAVTTVRDRVDFWKPLAEDQHRRMDVNLPTAAILVPLAVEDLADLIDVLVDNVFAHTPEGVSLGVDVTTEGEFVVLVVSDDGPGLPTEGRADRRGSSGLGLDIARRTARATGGDLAIGPGVHGGLSVRVNLPRLRG